MYNGIIFPPLTQGGCTAEASIECRLAKETQHCARVSHVFLFTSNVTALEQVRGRTFQLGNSHLNHCLEHSTRCAKLPFPHCFYDTCFPIKKCSLTTKVRCMVAHGAIA